MYLFAKSSLYLKIAEKNDVKDRSGNFFLSFFLRSYITTETYQKIIGIIHSIHREKKKQKYQLDKVNVPSMIRTSTHISCYVNKRIAAA